MMTYRSYVKYLIPAIFVDLRHRNLNRVRRSGCHQQEYRRRYQPYIETSQHDALPAEKLVLTFPDVRSPDSRAE